LLFIELNEINFDIVKLYLDMNYSLPNFSKINEFSSINTFAEEKYEAIEPWIQWHSIHTGQDYNEHKIFRLGDGVKSKSKNIYNKLQDLNYTVGAISPMNLKNNLTNPKYFIPDPWTNTVADNSWWSKKIHSLIIQSVNDNSSTKLTLTSIFTLLIGIIRFAKIKNYFKYIYLALFSFKKNKWRKSLFLDLFLNDININYLRTYSPNYSSIFLNAGAHIQHHYLFNSTALNKPKNPDWYIKANVDPILEMLKIYDSILGDCINLKLPLIIATGLSQSPYELNTFYYRLLNHKSFFMILKVKFKEVYPRMSRDFLVTFHNNLDRDNCIKFLSVIREEVTGIKLFEEIEERDKSIFVTLTFPNEIKENYYILINEEKFLLKKNVVFNSIKNGHHQSKGFAFFSESLEKYKPSDNSHVKDIHNTILSYFQEKYIY
jgi:hypothetical protein